MPTMSELIAAGLAPEEAQELLSKVYIDAARVARTTSGKFAVFSMARGDLVAICEEPQLAAAVALACQRSAEAWIRENEQEHSSAPAASTIEDLGL